ncbi:MAG: histidine kinase [Fibrobacteres bacterium]|nr:histidine kinase [Fibrobacterota bacterium]
MQAVSGYTLTETLREDGEFVILRGFKDSNASQVLVETAVENAAGSSERLEHEYAIRAELDPAWAVRPIEQTRNQGRTCLVFGDPGGETLERLLQNPLPLADSLRIAIGISAALDRLHQRGLIHKDIKPANILVNAAGGEVRLMGFGIASLLPRERKEPEPLEVIEGTPAYMAPEQTGRMNRSVDSRSDLYSLGVTLYRMLTGTLPFTANDPVEWAHSHIARQPRPPAERAKDLPIPVSDLVMKLLAKTAEERYQTAKGVEADLRHCLEEWEASGTIAPFRLGDHDASGRLLIPEKLYGREEESRELLEAFSRVEATGLPELMLVSGYSGVGKSSLVNELHKVILLPRGLFTSGKFDQDKRDIPYFTFAKAFQTLVRKILAGNPDEVSAWGEAIREAVGPDGQLIVDHIPELEILIGKQPPVPELASQEAQNRFHEVHRKFLGAFARKEHPLVLFLDDLQWQDLASLKLLEYLITHPDVRNLLLVGAYRDNEVFPSHPLTVTLGAIRKSGAIVNHILLRPLSIGDLRGLIADTLHCDWTHAEPLVRLIHEKTAGNPFFVIQFLTVLYEERLLEFDAQSAAWTWDVERIRAQNYTDNVVNLMVRKLKRLPCDTLDVLKRIACLGSNTDIATLIKVHGGTEQEVHAHLWGAVLASLLLRTGDTYRFLHDRVQEAAYSLIPKEARAEEHLRIGRRLLAGMTEESVEENVFFLVGQFNRGLGLVTDPAEKESVRRLNAQAGRRAKATTAYGSALGYLTQAMDLLPPDAWTTMYEDTFHLVLDLSECEYLVGNFERADGLFNLILAKARSHPDSAKVYQLRAKLCQVAGRYQDSLEAALEGLKLLGVTFPESAEEIRAAVAEGFQEILINMRGRSVADLADAPAATDPEARAIINLSAELTPPSYAAKSKYYALNILKGVNTVLTHGNTEESCLSYAYYAFLLVAVFGDVASAMEFSALSLRLNDRFENPKLKGTLFFLHGHLSNLVRPYSTSLPLLDQAFDASLSIGDLTTAGYSAMTAMWDRMEVGEALDDVSRKTQQYLVFARRSRNEPIYLVVRQYQQFLACLKGLTRGPTSLDDDTYDEAEVLAFFTEGGFISGVAFYHIVKQILAVTFANFEEALEHSIQAEANLTEVTASPQESNQPFFHALALTALYPQMPEERQREAAKVLAEKLRILKMLADNGPENYANRYTLVLAEAARIEGRDQEAMRLYDQAIESARESGFVHRESLANEVAARFYLDRGFKTIANAYLRNARAGYLRWGALGKVTQLDQRYGAIEAVQAPLGPTATIGAPMGQLDLMTVVKASQAVSGEIVLGTLVKKLLIILVEHAGAERGLLILPRGGAWIEEAEALTLRDKVEVRFRHSPLAPEDLPQSILQFSLRTRERVILDDASAPNPYSEDEYLLRKHPRSILCLPLVKQAKLVAMLYVENNLTPRAFTPNRVAVLDVLASQAAISLENALLYDGLNRENAERKRAEERFSKVFRNSPSPMAISRMKDGIFIDVNEKFLGTFGFEREEFIGRSAVELGIASAEQIEDARKSLSEKGFVHALEFPAKTKSGESRMLLVSLESIDLDGEKCILMTYLDMTERQRMEEQLRHSQKMEAIGRLAGGVAHDFNNLLTAINGYSALILEGMDASNPNYAFMQEILKSGERAASLTRQLLAHSRRQILKPEVWNLNEIVGDMSSMLQRLVGEDIRLETILSPKLGLVKVDRGQIEQILLNLVINARDAMPKGGKLILRTENVLLDTPYLGTHLEAAPGPHVMLSISDTGSGMTPEVKARLFEPFFTTKEAGKGTGLGLSVVYGIVKQSGGSISVYSEVGTGTMFRIYFPEVEPEERVAREAPPAEKMESLHGDETILLVEDADAVRKFARMSLEAQGYKVLEAGNGVEALQVLENAPQVDMVVTDVVMPDMGGVALSKQIREHWPALPILFISGYVEHTEIHNGMVGKDERLLQKPFSPLELVRKVREVLEQWAASPSKRK